MPTLTEYRRAGYFSAAETALRLGIKQATLYAYVSRRPTGPVTRG